MKPFRVAGAKYQIPIAVTDKKILKTKNLVVGTIRLDAGGGHWAQSSRAGTSLSAAVIGKRFPKKDTGRVRLMVNLLNHVRTDIYLK